MVIVECKSGGGKSTPAQTNAYLEFLLEESKANVTSHYFAYSQESSMPPTPEDYFSFFHRVFRGIAQISSVEGTRGTATIARPYFFARMSLEDTGNALQALNPVLDAAARERIISENPLSEIFKVKVLNDPFARKAAIRLRIFHVKRSSPSSIARTARKSAQEVMKTARRTRARFGPRLSIGYAIKNK